jgi:hypothetical protein
MTSKCFGPFFTLLICTESAKDPNLDDRTHWGMSIHPRHCRLGDEASGFYAEFLTPPIGGLYDRKHRRIATAEIAGVSSQQLRYIELLLNQPWSVDLEYRKVRVANPVSFLAQKVLIHRTRQRENRAKDILYMHDTLEVFGARLPELRHLWRSIVALQLQRRGVRLISNASENVFGELSDDIRRAAEISAQRGLSPEAIREVCSYGLIEIFGT